MAEALHGVGEETALKSLLEILLSTGCVSVQEFKGEEAVKGHRFPSPPPIGAAEAGGLSHKMGHSQPNSPCGHTGRLHRAAHVVPAVSSALQPPL